MWPLLKNSALNPKRFLGWREGTLWPHEDPKDKLRQKTVSDRGRRHLKLKGLLVLEGHFTLDMAIFTSKKAQCVMKRPTLSLGGAIPSLRRRPFPDMKEVLSAS